MTKRVLGLGAGLVLLAACAAPPPVEEIPFDPVIAQPDPIPVQPVGSQPVPPGTVGVSPVTPVDPLDQTTAPDTVIVENQGGLVERLPNTCKLENYERFRGQNAASLVPGSLDRPFRTVGPTAIVSQEYNPQRVNFYTDGSGTITRISCG